MLFLQLLSLQQTAYTATAPHIPLFNFRFLHLHEQHCSRIKKDSNDDRKLINQAPLIFVLAIDGSLQTRTRRGFIINSHVYTLERLAAVQTGSLIVSNGGRRNLFRPVKISH